MPESSKPIVRLAKAAAEKKPRKATSPAPITKLAVRLAEGVNEALRSMIRYRGDLTAMAIEALTAADLTKMPLVSLDEPMVRDTTISFPRQLHKNLKRIAKERNTSMNILVNTGLAHWLAKKGAIALR